MVRDGARYEREVKKLLEEEGWLVLRVAGSGTEQGDSCDLVAMKGQHTTLLEVKTYSDLDGTVDTVEEMLQLRRMREKVDECITLIAHRKMGDKTWYYTDSEEGRVKKDDDHGRLREFIDFLDNV